MACLTGKKIVEEKTLTAEKPIDIKEIKEKPKANPVVLDEYLPSLGPSGI